MMSSQRRRMHYKWPLPQRPIVDYAKSCNTCITATVDGKGKKDIQETACFDTLPSKVTKHNDEDPTNQTTAN